MITVYFYFYFFAGFLIIFLGHYLGRLTAMLANITGSEGRWVEATRKARELVRRMALEEKVSGMLPNAYGGMLLMAGGMF